MSKVTLTWDLPVARTDGTPLSPDEIASIDVFDSAATDPTVPIGSTQGAQTGFTTDTLSVGDHVFSMVVNDTTGHKSAASVGVPVTIAPTLAAPNPVTNVQAAIIP